MRHQVMMGVVAAMVVPGLIACSANGNEIPKSNAVSATLWDPCYGISDDVLRTAGLLPATKDSGITRSLHDRQKICRWDAPESAYSVTVFSADETVTETELKPWNVDFQDVTLAGRAGRRFKIAGDSKPFGCNVLFAAEQGAIQIHVFIDPSLVEREQPCQRLDLVGRSIVPVLPR
ncbi:DUF3558 domain-containing protein [Nocardia sp. NPDC051321]|uniref:DUF3558 domain-containing protein n=1 Tax=Nocardia sp. NPDC051321 TaxID=3364323 RepID=UPI00379692C2